MWKISYSGILNGISKVIFHGILQAGRIQGLIKSVYMTELPVSSNRPQNFQKAQTNSTDEKKDTHPVSFVTEIQEKTKSHPSTTFFDDDITDRVFVEKYEIISPSPPNVFPNHNK